MWAIDVEHIGVAAYGGAEVGLCAWNPFLLELGAVDAPQAELGHDAGNSILGMSVRALYFWWIKQDLQIQSRQQ